MTDEPRSANVTALRDSQVLELSGEAFSNLVSQFPDTLRGITTRSVRRLVRIAARGKARPARSSRSPSVPLSADRPRPGSRIGCTTRSIGSPVRPATSPPPRRPPPLGRPRPRRRRPTGVVVRRTRARLRGGRLLRRARAERLDGSVRAPGRPRAARRRRRRSSPRCARVEREIEARRALGARPAPSWCSCTRRTHAIRAAPAVAARPHRRSSSPRARRSRRRRSTASRGSCSAAGIGVGVQRRRRTVSPVSACSRALNERGVPIDAVGGTSIGSLIAGGGRRAHARRAGAPAQGRGRRLVTVRRDVPRAVAGDGPSRHRAHSGVGRRPRHRGRVAQLLLRVDQPDDRTHRDPPLGPGVARDPRQLLDPGVFPPVRSANGDLLVDGGLLDNLPVGVMRSVHHGSP